MAKKLKKRLLRDSDSSEDSESFEGYEHEGEDAKAETAYVPAKVKRQNKRDREEVER